MARGAFPDSHPQHLGMPGMHGTVAAVTALQKADLLVTPRRPLRRPGDRQAVDLRPERQGHPRRHRPGRDLQEPHRRRARSSATASEVHRRARSPRSGRARGRPARRPTRLVARSWTPGATHLPAGLRRPPDDGSLAPQYVIERHRRDRRARRRSTSPASASTRCGPRSSSSYEHPNTWLNSGGAGHDGLRRAGGDGRQGRPSPTARSGRSTATAASR